MARTRGRRCKRSAAWNRELGCLHLERQAASGLSVQDYCFAHGLPVRVFSHWRRNLKRAGSTGPDAVIELGAPAPPMFLEVAVDLPTSMRSVPCAELVLRGGRRLEVRADFDEGELRRLVGFLESLPS